MALATLLGGPLVVPPATYAYDAVKQVSPDDHDVAPLTRVDIRQVEVVPARSNVLRNGPEGSALHLTEAQAPFTTSRHGFIATNTVSRRATSMSLEDSLEYHWQEHGAGKTKADYIDDRDQVG